MKEFFVDYYLNFSNTYRLCYCENAKDYAALNKNAERISRKEALKLCADEKRARRHNPNFAHFADVTIVPAEYSSCGNPWNEEALYLSCNGRIWERVPEAKQ